MGKPKGPLGVVFADPFGAQISCFDGIKALRKWGKSTGLDVTDWGPACYGLAIRGEDKNGITWFAIALEDRASIRTLVHECSHMVDFIHDTFGVPIEMQNTEIRAYQLAALVMDVSSVFGFETTRQSR